MVSRPGDSPLEMLAGQALLDRARALSNQPEDQIARACGYVGPSGRVMKKSFYRLGRSERVKAPTALPTVMESARGASRRPKVGGLQPEL